MNSGMRATVEPNAYVLGHSEQELARLERQGEIFGVETREVLRRAGVKAGMRVLDVGCGGGDVTMIAAEQVGPTGVVVGIDSAPAAVATAAARARRAGYAWAEFENADLYKYQPARGFDAIVGRFVLLHVADPTAALRGFAGLLNDGGVIAFIEMDIDQAGAVPDMPLLRQYLEWIVATYRHVGVEPNMGSKLYATFRSAGFTPRLTGSTRIESGPDSVVYQFAAQTLVSLLPAVEKFGIATAEEIGIDTLAERLRVAAIAGDHCIFMPRLIGAWAAKPAAG
jgi:ubiquinone/menaquinone biosynthesis C-methylase UbiE